MSARFNFDFFTPNKGAPSFVKANFNVELWIGDTCLLTTKDWSMRESKEGKIYPVGPQKKYVKDGKDVYFNLVMFFPSTDPNDKGVTPGFKKFPDECINAYNEWLANGSPRGGAPRRAPQVQNDGSSLQPRIPAQGSGQPAPAGWTAGYDRQSGRRYYTDGQGNVAFDGDPRLSSPPGTPKPTQPQNDPFASFGSVPGR